MCKVLNSIRCSNGYAGRDPQGGTSDGSLFSKLSLFLFILLFTMVFTMRSVVFTMRSVKEIGKMWSWLSKLKKEKKIIN